MTLTREGEDRNRMRGVIEMIKNSILFCFPSAKERDFFSYGRLSFFFRAEFMFQNLSIIPDIITKEINFNFQWNSYPARVFAHTEAD